MSSSNSCFLTCIQASQEAGQVVWYSHVCQVSLILEPHLGHKDASQNLMCTQLTLGSCEKADVNSNGVGAPEVVHFLQAPRWYKSSGGLAQGTLSVAVK